MIANRKLSRSPFPSTGLRCRKQVEMTVDASLLQILAAADLGDEEDVAIREILFEALRDLGAQRSAAARSAAASLRAGARPRQHRRAAACAPGASRATRRSPCTFRR